MMAINILCMLTVALIAVSWGVLIHDIESTEKRKKREANERNNKIK